MNPQDEEILARMQEKGKKNASTTNVEEKDEHPTQKKKRNPSLMILQMEFIDFYNKEGLRGSIKFHTTLNSLTKR